MAEKFIPYADLAAWLSELAKTFSVFAPQQQGPAVVYSTWSGAIDPAARPRPTESAKKALFPRAEELFRFHYAKDHESSGLVEGGNLGRLTVSEPPEPRPVLIFGLLPCDARGFLAFDPVYDGSGTKGLARDVYYLRRREQAVLIARACKTALATCFCTSVGGGPADKSAADVLCTDVEGGLILEPLTGKGRAVLSSPLLRNADATASASARSAHAAALSQLPPRWTEGTLAGARDCLNSLFDDAAFWQKQSAPCLSCGACTYLCPTCYCFNITDENSGNSGVRLRSWDSCMSFQFTQEASGHNPRAKKFQRLRNRVNHKFAYYPGLHQGRVACTGCGRCIKSCPSSVDIRAIVKDALDASNSAQSAALPEGQNISNIPGEK